MPWRFQLFSRFQLRPSSAGSSAVATLFCHGIPALSRAILSKLKRIIPAVDLAPTGLIPAVAVHLLFQLTRPISPYFSAWFILDLRKGLEAAGRNETARRLFYEGIHSNKPKKLTLPL